VIKIHVEHEYPNQRCEDVFAALSDHVNFFAKARMKCSLLKNGDTEPNGVGAVREVRAGSAHLIEHITAFQAPHFYQYRIEKLYSSFFLIPFKHDLGRIFVEPTEQGCKVLWDSHFQCTLPMIGGWISRRMGEQVETTFKILLRKAMD
jgi:hypothetical protein